MSTQQDFAEGSGSTWEGLDGDPRIQPGAEVLVGNHRGIPTGPGSALVFHNWNAAMLTYVGSRCRVTKIEGMCTTDQARSVLLVFLMEGKNTGWSWRVRDLVCLKTADGKLTDEGVTLERLEFLGWDSWPVDYVQDDPMLTWAVRAGLLTMAARADRYAIDQRRLAMALGREEPSDGDCAAPDCQRAVPLPSPYPPKHHCINCRYTAARPSEEPCWTCMDERQRGLGDYPRWTAPLTFDGGDQEPLKPPNILGAELIHRELSPLEIRERAAQFFKPSKEGVAIGQAKQLVVKTEQTKKPMPLELKLQASYNGSVWEEIPTLVTSAGPLGCTCPGCGSPSVLGFYGACADCMQVADDESTAHDVRPAPVEDHSGEAHLAELRRFLFGPHLERRHR